MGIFYSPKSSDYFNKLARERYESDLKLLPADAL